MKNRNIYLVGFMGAGKTSVGIRLAELLQWKFIDLDQEIEKHERRSIREIFRADGEAWFRELERNELGRVSSQQNVVVALGGGAFMDDQNRKTIASSGISVWLDASMDTLYPRCAEDASRPLVASREEMEQLLERRRPHYKKATLRIEVDERTIDDLARLILQNVSP